MHPHSCGSYAVMPYDTHVAAQHGHSIGIGGASVHFCMVPLARSAVFLDLSSHWSICAPATHTTACRLTSSETTNVVSCEFEPTTYVSALTTRRCGGSQPRRASMLLRQWKIAKETMRLDGMDEKLQWQAPTATAWHTVDSLSRRSPTSGRPSASASFF